ncbi:MAG TPA: glycosyltransferase family 2 protein [Acidimicrobiales bacterium]|nr:glycosyltransferase family 2 protein [Acidimicrobiales bacterium]
MSVAPGRAPLLSAVLITRDEGRFLGGCLESLSGIADEVVVVDTGSVDDTPDIARRFGARLVHHPWREDFAEARNVSLERATGRWILYVDADERLVDADRSGLEDLLGDAEEVAFRVLLRPRVGATPYREFRLWRSDPRIRFEGVIHEKVVPAIQRVADEDGRPIGVADLMLQHLGYEGDQTRKHLRNLPLLRRQLAVEPENLFAWNHLGRVLEALGETEEAEAAFARAVETARAAPAGQPIDRLACLSYGDLVRLRASRGGDVSDLLAEALAAFPDNCLLLLMHAQQLMERRAYEAALAPLEQIVQFDWARADDPPAYDAPIVGELPWSAKALCLFRLGAYADAAEAYAQASLHAPEDPSYRVKADLARARARRASSGAPPSSG